MYHCDTQIVHHLDVPLESGVTTVPFLTSLCRSSVISASRTANLDSSSLICLCNTSMILQNHSFNIPNIVNCTNTQSSNTNCQDYSSHRIYDSQNHAHDFPKSKSHPYYTKHHTNTLSQNTHQQQYCSHIVHDMMETLHGIHNKQSQFPDIYLLRKHVGNIISLI